jgi:hypothetical protein
LEGGIWNFGAGVLGYSVIRAVCVLYLSVCVVNELCVIMSGLTSTVYIAVDIKVNQETVYIYFFVGARNKSTRIFFPVLIFSRVVHSRIPPMWYVNFM